MARLSPPICFSLFVIACMGDVTAGDQSTGLISDGGAIGCALCDSGSLGYFDCNSESSQSCFNTGSGSVNTGSGSVNTGDVSLSTTEDASVGVDSPNAGPEAGAGTTQTANPASHESTTSDDVQKPDDKPSSKDAGMEAGVDGVVECSPSVVPTHSLLHLTRTQFERTVSDLVGEAFYATQFPDEERLGGFASPKSVDATLTRAWWDAAEKLTSIFGAKLDERLAYYASCSLTDGAACVGKFITAFGLRAYRRPMSTSEVAQMQALYDGTLADGNTSEQSVLAVVHAFFLSPSFTYRIEAPPANVGASISDWELASRLSYLFWGTAPDPTLLKLASDGKLSQPAELEKQVDRLLNDANAKRMARDFANQWLELNLIDRMSISADSAVAETSSFQASDTQASVTYTAPANHVWSIAASSVTSPFNSIRINAEVKALNEPIDFQIWVDDEIVKQGEIFGTGMATLSASMTLQTGVAAKVEIRFPNLSSDRRLLVHTLMLRHVYAVDDMRWAMKNQALDFVEQLLLGSTSTYSDLLTSAAYPESDLLNDTHKLDGELSAAEGAADSRSGILTLPALLAIHGGQYSGETSPILRGRWLMERVLCLPSPPPLPQLPDYCSVSCSDEAPCGIGYTCTQGACIAESAPQCDDNDDCASTQVCSTFKQCVPNPSFCIPPRTGDQTTRQWWDSFGSSCHTCHTSINGVGYALEHFDGLGRYRLTQTTSEGAEAINAGGQISSGNKVTKLYGAQGLATEALKTTLGSKCYSDAVFNFAFSQPASTSRGTQCTSDAYFEQFATDGLNLRALFRSIALSPQFRSSSPAQ